MRRRDFIGGALAAGFVGGSALPLPGPWPGDDELCRTPRPLLRASHNRGSHDLVYEGTHILTYGALREVAKRYAGPVPLVVRGGGCDNAIFGVREGGADLGGMCCPVHGSRAEGLRSLMVARDVKAVIAHPSVPLDDLPLEALRAIAAGELTDWRKLDAGSGPIALVVRRHCADYAEPVRTALIGRDAQWPSRGLFVNTDENVVESVMRFPRAIGVASWVFVKPHADKLKLLSLDGIPPTPAAAAAGRYPLMAPLSIIFDGWRADLMAPLFDYLYGPEGRAIIADRLVPVSAAEAGYPPA